MLTKVVSREKLKLCVGLAGMNSDWRLRLKISSVMGWKGRLLDALPCGSSPHALSKLIHELIPKVFNASFFFIYWEVTKAWKVWLLIMRSVPKSAAIFLGQWLRRVRHAETGKKEKKENKGHSALWAELKPRAFLGHWLWVRERAKTQKRESFS